MAQAVHWHAGLCTPRSWCALVGPAQPTTTFARGQWAASHICLHFSAVGVRMAGWEGREHAVGPPWPLTRSPSRNPSPYLSSRAVVFSAALAASFLNGMASKSPLAFCFGANAARRRWDELRGLGGVGGQGGAAPSEVAPRIGPVPAPISSGSAQKLGSLGSRLDLTRSDQVEARQDPPRGAHLGMPETSQTPPPAPPALCAFPLVALVPGILAADPTKSSARRLAVAKRAFRPQVIFPPIWPHIQPSGTKWKQPPPPEIPARPPAPIATPAPSAPHRNMPHREKSGFNPTTKTTRRGNQGFARNR